MIRKRLGPNPHAGGARTPSLQGCPDVFELESGDFALIGSNITTEALRHLPPDASCGPDECIVRVPRRTLVLAKPDIPDTVLSPALRAFSSLRPARYNAGHGDFCLGG